MFLRCFIHNYACEFKTNWVNDLQNRKTILNDLNLHETSFWSVKLKVKFFFYISSQLKVITESYKNQSQQRSYEIK
jgi:hypothetical protein